MMNAREVMARAGHDHLSSVPWDETFGGVRRNLLLMADKQLAAYHAHLEAAGLAIVPVEATEAMLSRGHQLIDWCRNDQKTNTNDHPSQTEGGGTSCKTDLADAYRAMIAAAKDQNDG